MRFQLENGKEFVGTLDSAADRTTMSHHTAKRLGIEIGPYTGPKLWSATGHKLKMIGTAQVECWPVQEPERKITESIHITAEGTDKTLIGYEFLTKNGFCLLPNVEGEIIKYDHTGKEPNDKRNQEANIVYKDVRKGTLSKESKKIIKKWAELHQLQLWREEVAVGRLTAILQNKGIKVKSNTVIENQLMEIWKEVALEGISGHPDRNDVNEVVAEFRKGQLTRHGEEIVDWWLLQSDIDEYYAKQGIEGAMCEAWATIQVNTGLSRSELKLVAETKKINRKVKELVEYATTWTHIGKYDHTTKEPNDKWFKDNVLKSDIAAGKLGKYSRKQVEQLIRENYITENTDRTPEEMMLETWVVIGHKLDWTMNRMSKESMSKHQIEVQILKIILKLKKEKLKKYNHTGKEPNDWRMFGLIMLLALVMGVNGEVIIPYGLSLIHI